MLTTFTAATEETATIGRRVESTDTASAPYGLMGCSPARRCASLSSAETGSGRKR
jgi:hypothetical protein